MIPLPQTSPKQQRFENKIIDNEGFFQTMEEEIPSLLSIAETKIQTRQAIKQLLAEMRKQTFIRGVTEWTAQEQEKFFHQVQSEVMRAKVISSNMIREKIQTLIEDELWREINDDGKKYSLQDGSGNTVISNMEQYQNFLDTSFISSKETTVIPLDLRLTVSKTETIQDAEKKLLKYGGKYNALILLDDKNNPIGVIQAAIIEQHKQNGHMLLEGIPRLSGVFGYYGTSSDELKRIMQENNINIIPIVDSKTGILIGILTSNSVLKKEVHYYSTTSITRLSIEVSMNMSAHENEKMTV
ncbi:MAG: CBS domain-containing protein [Candidatus Gracilibacteria bacterium]|nr:CBS domain-containing protein [Candidatus Gracilibacteria bacterium]